MGKVGTSWGWRASLVNVGVFEIPNVTIDDFEDSDGRAGRGALAPRRRGARSHPQGLCPGTSWDPHRQSPLIATQTSTRRCRGRPRLSVERKGGAGA